MKPKVYKKSFKKEAFNDHLKGLKKWNLKTNWRKSIVKMV